MRVFLLLVLLLLPPPALAADLRERMIRATTEAELEAVQAAAAGHPLLLGQVLHRRGRLDEALRALEAAGPEAALTRAEILATRGHFAEAEALYEQAGGARGLAGLVAVRSLTSPSPEDLLEPARRAVRLAGADLSARAEAEFALGQVLAACRRSDEALRLQEAALDTIRRRGDRWTEARIMLGLATSLSDPGRGRLAEALDLAGKGRAALEALGDRASLLDAVSIEAGLQMALGRNGEAVAAFRRAADLAVGLGDRFAEATARTGLGHALMLTGHPEEAAAAQARALELARELRLPTLEPTLLRSLALAWLALNQPEAAADFAGQALERSRTPAQRAQALSVGAVAAAQQGRHDRARGLLETALQDLDDPAVRASLLEQLAGEHLAEGQPDRAAALLREARALAATAGLRGREGWLAVRQGDAAWRAGRLEEARDHYRSAREAALAMQDRNLEWAALGGLGELGLAGGDREEGLEATRRAADLAADLADPLRLAVVHWKQAQYARRLEDADALYRSAAELMDTVPAGTRSDDLKVGLHEERQALYEQWADLLDRQGRPEEALAVLERARARAFLDLLGARRAAERAPRPLPFARLPQEVPVLYFAQLERRLLIYLLLPDGTLHRTERLLSREDLAARVLEARRGMTGAPTAEKALADLGAAVLPGALLQVLPPGELLVVPHRDLFLAPLPALPLPDGSLLGERFALRLAPSLSALEALPGATAARGAVVFGNPAMPSAELDPLPAAEEEARSVAARWGAEPVLGARATEAEFRRRAPEARVLHLSTHGVASESSPLEGYVALAAGAGEDGFLKVAEVLEIRLDADLVALSACRTGLGRLRAGEGVVGLSRAFLAAGARRLLVSLWSVEDSATRHLMATFHERLAAGASPARALQEAAASVRAREEWSHPAFWSGFVLLGR